MMSELQQFIDVTKNIIALASDVSANEREQVISDIDDLLDQRENILTKIKPPFSQEELNLCEILPSINQQLEVAMMQLQKEIQANLQELEIKKTSYKKYVNPYEAAESNDGAFYDKRK